jgi:PIN domain nuclease of toxin-antitoxin system
MLLDTHIWLRWLASAGTNDELPAPVLAKLQTAPDLAVSAVSCWEAAYLARKGRIHLPLPISQWLLEALAGSGIACIPLDETMAATAAGLSDIHRDPADRFIIATALLTGRQLLTLDGVIAQYPELTGKLA